MLTPFKCLKFKSYIQFSFTIHQCSSIPNQTIPEKNPKNRFEGMELTAIEVIASGIFCNELEKERNL